MKYAQLVIAKIRPEIYQLIEEGRKTWEVRDNIFYVRSSDYDNSIIRPVVIYYTDLNGAPLGLWETDTRSVIDLWCDLEPDGSLNDSAYIMQRRSGISESLFRELFPLETGVRLYRIRLTRKLNSLTDLFVEEEA